MIRLTGRAGVMSAVAVAALLAAGPSSIAQEGGPQTVASQSGETCVNPTPSHVAFSGMIVGFSQSENEQNPFRAAETRSVRDAAQAAGVKRLLYTNAADNQAKQVADMQSMIAQGAQAIIVAPLNATGLQPALDQAAAQGIPVVAIDRETAGTPCKPLITFLGSDFHAQGLRAAAALAEATGGRAKIVEIQGAYGNSVETERTEGFAEGLKLHPDMHLLSAQTGNWSATDAQRVLDQVLLAHPESDALYAQADVMALGAMTAIQQSGREPGKDVKIVSIDGTKALVQAIVDGHAQADIETNPRFGTLSFQAISDWFAGKPVARTMTMKDALYTADNAPEALKSGAPY